jgi:PadR family transcriptional regulator PadR
MPSPASAQTALDLLVLTVLSRRAPLHGYGIATAIEELSEEALRIEEGSLYPALYRMEEVGWITAEWTVTENKRRARVYRLTRAGRKQLAAEIQRWTDFSAGVVRVLRYA